MILCVPFLEVEVGCGAFISFIFRGSPERDYTFRVNKLRRIENERIDDTEDRSVRTDSQRQRHSCNQREARLLPHATKRLLQVLPKPRHRFTSA
jgi:hypothetical protein